MKCTNPIFLKNDKVPFFSIIKHDNGSKSALNGFYVPCGQCMACRLNYSKMWSIRMMDELKKHDSACFVTLTYDDEHLPEDKELHKEDLQKFWKRLRKQRKVRYFCCGEHGDTFGRPHYHAIIYGVSPQETDLIQDCWDQGFVKLGTVTEDSCVYVAKYMTKKLRGLALQKKLEEDPTFQNEFVLMSRRPGIGLPLSKEVIEFMQNNGFVWRKGHRSSIPRCYKDKYDIHCGIVEELNSDYKNKLLIQDKVNDIVAYSRKFLFGKV